VLSVADSDNQEQLSTYVVASVAKTLETMEVVPVFIKLLAPEGLSALMS